MRHWLALGLAVIAGMSCLLDDDEGDPSSYVGVNEIAEAYKDAQCTYLVACGLFPTQEACLGAQLTSSSSAFQLDPNVEAAIYAGHVIYNGANVKACLDALAARSCDETDKSARVVPPECRAFFRGTLMAGEGCYVDEECISQFCSGDSNSTCSLGTCVGDTPPAIQVAQVGDSCSSITACIDGAYCDTLTDLCTPLKTSGMACTLDSECAYNLGCVGTTGNRTCSVVSGLGDPCATTGTCRDEGTYCDFNADQCKRYLLPGAQCGTSGSTCSPYYPCDYTVTTPVCAQGPSLGQPCSSSERCFDAGTFCDFNLSAPVCVALKTEGMACNSSQECVSRSCDVSLGVPVCVTPATCF